MPLSWKTSPTFTCQSLCNFFPLNPSLSPTPSANYISPQDKELRALLLLAFWPLHSPGNPVSGHGHNCHPYPHHPCTCQPHFWPPSPSLPLRCFALDLCLSAPTLTFARPINPSCLLIDLLISNSLLHW